ncbi:HlyD family type I secretion periplasmic adaptor subunit [Accumulibacter sp.]|uniref:HlyD family type I secretion periplasmic adaptor subunit n=1 Tax=Accumulibacter sp. TaxID=2053492 RepID=UPI00260D434D|nr:HlyD family type I secretion periplasmic adaptor subunit [Accumulibacter sp.]
MSRPRTPRLAAALDLGRRYAAVFGQSWRERKRLDDPPRLPHETQFLPAALELQETPVSPAPRAAMWLLVAFAAIAVLWAVFGQIDIVATARGRIVPSDRSKTIQPFETATVKAIRVSDGQPVKTGEVLLELDATSAEADRARFANDRISALAQGARARALLAAIDAGLPPVLERLPDVPAERQAQEQRILDGQYGEYQARRRRIDADLERRQAELGSTQEIVGKLEQTVPIARQRALDFRDLVDKEFISKHGYLEKEQVRIEQEGDLATQRSRLRELTAAIAEVRGQRAALIAETRRLALDTLNEAEQKASTFGQELIKAESRGRLLTLTAPVDGTVQQLAVPTVGGVVTPAQALMVIVPVDNPLEVEAFIENKDVGFVDAGQEAVVKIETFPFTRHGTVPGRVTHVSGDAINDEKRGLIYSARVLLGRTTMPVEGKVVQLSPGMAVTVEVKTGRRRVIEYFLSPLLQHADESLRER